MPLPHSLRAFRHRDYRLYFAGQGITQIGTWLQLIATVGSPGTELEFAL